MKSRYAASATLAVALVLAGCSPDAGPRESSGAVIGGVTGGVLGNIVGAGAGGAGRVATTAFGAALGAIVGGQIGRSMDEQDRQYAYETANLSLRENRVQYWNNPDNGHRGEFRPRRSYLRDGRWCRDFTHTIWVGGEPDYVEGTACQRPDGSWHVVS
jgi:surface antigen